MLETIDSLLVNKNPLIEFVTKNWSSHIHNTALIYNDQKISYGEIDTFSENVRGMLQYYGIMPGHVVALLCSKTPELIFSLMGVIKAGAKFLLIDPAQPLERITYFLNTANVSFILSNQLHIQPQEFSKIPFFKWNNYVEFIQKIHSFKPKFSFEIEDCRVDSDLYVTFTSGTTGLPKMIEGTISPLIHYLTWSKQKFNYQSHDHYTSLAGIAHDPFLRDIFVPLSLGAKLFLTDQLNQKIADGSLVKWLHEHEISVLHLTPSLLRIIIQQLETNKLALPHLQSILCGSEKLYYSDVKKITNYAPITSFYNCYGTTETPQIIAYHKVDLHQEYEEREVVPIGRAAPGHQLTLVPIEDKEKNFFMIEINSRYLAKQYSLRGRYNTGDLAQYDRDNNIVCIGRNTQFIKKRGYRISAQEIQKAVSEKVFCEYVDVNYVEAEEKIELFIKTSQDVDPNKLLKDLAEKLPAYSLPDEIYVVDQLLVNFNNKIDYQALRNKAKGKVIQNFENVYFLEATLQKAFAKILNCQHVSLDESLMSYGINSLTATFIAAEISSSLGCFLSPYLILKAKSIRELIKEMSGFSQPQLNLNLDLMAAKKDDVKLSRAQIGMLVEKKLEKNSGIYNLYSCYVISEAPNKAQLETWLLNTVTRHQVFQYSTTEDYTFTIDGSKQLDLRFNKCDHQSVTEIKKILMKEINEDFNLKNYYSLRLIVLELTPEKHLLAFVAPHFFIDGFALNKVIADYFLNFNKNDIEVKDEGKNYRSYLSALNSLQDNLENSTDWQQMWQERIQSIEPSCLNTFKRNSNKHTSNGKASYFTIEGRVLEKIKQYETNNALTPKTMYLSAMYSLFYLLTRQKNLTFGNVLSGRYGEGMQNIVGHTVNTVLLRFDFQESLNFYSLCDEITKELDVAFINQYYPFDTLVKLYRKYHPDAVNSLPFSLMFNYEIVDEQRKKYEQLSCASHFPFHNGTAKFDMTFYLEDRDNKVFGKWEYNTDLYEEQTIKRFIDHYLLILDQLLTHPDKALCDFELLTPEERLQCEGWNDTAHSYEESHQFISDPFLKQVTLHPDAIAVIAGSQKITYQELHDRSWSVAHRLRELGAVPNTLVAIIMEKSLDQITGCLGVVQSGAAYLPILSTEASGRLEVLLQQGHVKIVLTQKHLIHQIPQGYLTIAIEDIDLTKNTSPLLPIHTPQDLAYVIFTSGSTGIPKGVMIDHQAALNTLQDINERFNVTKDDRVYGISALNFDLSVYDIFGTLGAGASLILPSEIDRKDPSVWLQDIYDLGITIWNSVPAFMEMLCEYIRSMPSQKISSKLRLILMSGDWIPLSLPQEITSCFHTAKVMSLGGATEASIWSILYPIEEVDPSWPSIPYGRPMYNQRFYVMNEQLQILPIGIAGELYIGGVGLAKGYWDDEEKTRASFIVHPQSKERLYRTGDLGVYLEDGCIRFLGRKDQQVKLRGHRIELGEIERHLESYEGVERGIAVVREDIPKDFRLVAYITVSKFVDQIGLREHLLKKLPYYMIPSAFVEIAAIPLSLNGKVDKKLLPKPDYSSQEAHDELPRTEIEKTIAQIWQDILGIEKIGRYDHFFNHGGHSLAAIKMVNQLSSLLNKELPFRDLFANPILRDYAKTVENLQHKEGIQLLRYAKNTAPLTPVQNRLWFLEKFSPGNGAYSITSIYKVRGDLSNKRIMQAAYEVKSQHSILSSLFDDTPQMIIDSELSLQISIVDWSARQTTLDDISNFCKKIAITPYDFSKELGWKLFIIKISDHEKFIVFNFHHLIMDGVSLTIFMRDFFAALKMPAESNTHAHYQYLDYAHSLKNKDNEKYINLQIDYWLKKISDHPMQDFNFPVDHRRPLQQTFNGSVEYFDINREVIKKLAIFNSKYGYTRNIVFQAAYHLLLHIYSRSSTVLAGYMQAARTHKTIEDTIGFFSNTLIACSNYEVNIGFADFIKEFYQSLLEDYENQEAPFEQIVDKFNPIRTTNVTPIFQHMYVYQQIQEPNVNLDNIAIEKLRFDSDTAKFDMTLYIDDGGDNILGKWEYNTDLYEEQTIKRFIDHYLLILDQLLTHPDKALCDFELLTSEERLQCEGWNDTAHSYEESHQFISDPFLKQVTLHPDAIAVIAGSQKLSYQELHDRSWSVAHRLRELGAVPNTLVAIIMEKGLDQITGCLGVVQSGAAYLPILSTEASGRLEVLLQQGHVKIVLTQKHLIHQIPQGYLTIAIEDIDLTKNTSPLLPIHTPQDLAYVIFTSGSTGVPKGVMIDHQAALNTLQDINERFNVTKDDRVYGISALNFDLSVYDIFGTLGAGASLILPPEIDRKDPSVWLQDICDLGITIWNSVPAFMEMLCEYIRSMPSQKLSSKLRLILLSGDWIPLSLPQEITSCFNTAKVMSLGGATEASIWSILYPIEEVDPSWPSIPYGRPMYNQRFYVMNEQLQILPIGIAGELYIGGVGLAKGYWDDEEKTQASFIVHPQSKERLYRTGDLGVYLEDGCIRFLGRKDQQVKLRGHRIELGEIEAVLDSYPGIEKSIVVVAAEKSEQILLAYRVAREAIQQESLLNYLRTQLPNYMIPQVFMDIPEIPLNPNGKIDRKKLPRPFFSSSNYFEPPQSTMENLVSEIWKEILGLEKISRNDDFFALGGYSLKAVKVINAINTSQENLKATIKDIFLAPKLSEFCELLNKTQSKKFDDDTIEQGCI